MFVQFYHSLETKAESHTHFTFLGYLMTIFFLIKKNVNKNYKNPRKFRKFYKNPWVFLKYADFCLTLTNIRGFLCV